MDSLFEKKEQGGRGRRESKKERRRRKESKMGAVPLSSQEKEPELCLKPLLKWINAQEQEVEFSLEQFVQSQFQGYDQLPVVEGFTEEDDDGNIEYKLKLVSPPPQRIVHLTTQMKFRVNEGNGQAYYRIGVQNNGTPFGLERADMFESLRTICILAHNLKLQVVIVRCARGLKGMIVQLMVRKHVGIGLSVQIKMLLLGEEGSGKSTILGVLTTGELDDGRGRARMQVCMHKHDLLRGSTSSINQQVIGFSAEGKLLNKTSMMSSLQHVVLNSAKLITFIDVGGKKTNHIITSLHSFFPEYLTYVVSAKDPSKSTNPLKISSVFSVPVIVLITHADQGPQRVSQALKLVKEQLLELSPNKIPLVVKSNHDAVLFSRTLLEQDIIPVFQLSCLTGQGIDLFTNFLSVLPTQNNLRLRLDTHQLAEFIITDKFDVKGKLILGGTVIKGAVKRGKILHMGPDARGSFWPVQVTSIECRRVPVAVAAGGQTCTVGIRLLPFTQQWLAKQKGIIRKGMVLVDQRLNPHATNEFMVELQLYRPQPVITLNQKYKPVVNTMTSRQICKIIYDRKEEEQEEHAVLVRRRSKSIDTKPKKAPQPVTLRHRKKKSVDISQHMLFLEDEHIVDVLREKVSLIDYQTSRSEDQASETKQQLKKPEMKKTDPQRKYRRKAQLAGDRPFRLRLRFQRQCQYVQVGDRVIVHDECLQAFGRVTELIY